MKNLIHTLLWFFLITIWTSVFAFNLPEAVTPETYENNLIWDNDLEIVPQALPVAEMVYAEPAIAIQEDMVYAEPMVYPVEPFPYPKPVMIPPPFIEWPMIDIWYYGWWSEIDMYFYQFCESSSETYTCERYGDIVERLYPKVMKLAELIKTTFDDEKQDELEWMIRNIIENKFYEVSTEKSKFTISFIWIALQENLYEEDVEDIDAWLGDAITNLGSTWKIVSVSEAPGDMTTIVWNTISSKSNSFNLEVDARFDSDRPVTPNQGYELLAHFGEIWAYFIDRENIRNGWYDDTSKTWKFGSDWDEFRSFWWKLPDTSSVQFYLMCNFCEGEEFHPDRWNTKIADQKSFTFTKLDDNLEFDVELMVKDHSASILGENTTISVSYELINNGIAEIAGIRTNVWAYPMTDRGRFGEEEVDRMIIWAQCAWNAISEKDFYAGNIVLKSWETCVVWESITLEWVKSWQIEFSVDVESRKDQYWNNNNWNTLIELE